ncbi:DUF6233 domain-containing protein [Streptomyces sp. NBC_00885]|uniref:DUF6233 domain-containing protein n=1 Tax=Streptomyces sp. NBC_00885 TaxID=2975857 RepID=UPI0038690812
MSARGLELLRFLERVQLQQLDLTRRWLQQEEDRAHRAAHVPPPPPDWLIEYGIGVGRLPCRVHVGTCTMRGARSRPASREEALRALTEHVEPCTIVAPIESLACCDRRAVAAWRHEPPADSRAPDQPARGQTGHGARSDHRPCARRYGSTGVPQAGGTARRWGTAR